MHIFLLRRIIFPVPPYIQKRPVALCLFCLFALFISSGLVNGEVVNKDKQIVTNSLGMRFVLIPAGDFMMGSRESAESVASNRLYSDRTSMAEQVQDEHPLHRVTISTPFYLQETEVTLYQFQLFINQTGYQTESERDGWSWVKDPNQFMHVYTEKEGASWQNPFFLETAGGPLQTKQPVVQISRNDAEAFVAWLNRIEKTDRYTLPTEAEWEYACRGGTETPYYWGDFPEGSKANFADKTYVKIFPNARRANHKKEDGYAFTAPVGSYPANPFGLYDMSGNVFEWCKDWYGEYSESPVIDPQGPPRGKFGVLRGGAWNSSARLMRCASRHHLFPTRRNDATGFRVAMKYKP